MDERLNAADVDVRSPKLMSLPCCRCCCAEQAVTDILLLLKLEVALQTPAKFYTSLKLDTVAAAQAQESGLPSCYTAVVALAEVLLMGALSPKRWCCASAEPTLLLEWLQVRLSHHHCCCADVVAGWPLLLHTR
jgi:hypothetical protein